jgi:hypothetical protein
MGQKAIADKLKGLGKTYYLYSVSKGNHDWASLTMPGVYDKLRL